MNAERIVEKLSILADAAKYDVSCASKAAAIERMSTRNIFAQKQYKRSDCTVGAKPR
jgi:predicted DNA-binding helix-hairpin-helix protein